VERRKNHKERQQIRLPELESKEITSDKRLFYTYRVGIDDVMPISVGGIPNMDRWRVATHALDSVMPTFDDTPVIIKPKTIANPIELEMFGVGNYVHPIAMPIMKNGTVHPPSIHDQRQYNEQYAVGRTKAFKNVKGEWRFRLEITDPKVKERLLASENAEMDPKYISAQVFILPPYNQDTQNLTNVSGSHVIFTDRPAGGFDKMKMLARCHDNEEQCTIKLMNASQTGCGFCPAEAIQSIINSGSSHVGKNEIPSNRKMSLQPSSTGGITKPIVTATSTDEEKIKRLIKDPNYKYAKRGSEVERPGTRPEGEGPNNGNGEPGEEDEETRRLRSELQEIRRERAERQTAGQSELDQLKENLRKETLTLKQERARERVEKFMEKTKPMFKTRKGWEDAIAEIMQKLPYDDNDRLVQRLAELEEVWTARAEAMLVKVKSASVTTNSGMHDAPDFNPKPDSSIADVCLFFVEGLKRGIN
jgi:hypothetical protein